MAGHPIDFEQPLTVVELRQRFRYDPSTGTLYRRAKVGRGNDKVDKIAGTITKSGYLRVEIDNFGYMAHRLIFAIVKGRWPMPYMEVDHRDLDKSNNLFENLREATPSQNQINRGLRPHNTSGITGVNWNNNTSMWHAELSVGGGRVMNGVFWKLADAVRARRNALHMHAEFVNPDNINMCNEFLAKQEGV